MLRLKVGYISSLALLIIWFQFLYGTIKSTKSKDMIEELQEFQFLYGTIKRQVGRLYKSGWVTFQFLYGTIKSNAYLVLKSLKD